MAVGDLTSLANVKDWLGLSANPSTADDAVLSRLISAASALISSWCGRSFPLASYSETRDGNGKSQMIPAHQPVIAVTAITVNGRSLVPTVPGGTPGFYFTPTLIRLAGSAFVYGRGNVVLSYQAGFTVIPPDVEQACIELVAARFRDRNRAGLSTSTFSGQSLSFTASDLPASVKLALAPYQMQVVPC